MRICGAILTGHLFLLAFLLAPWFHVHDRAQIHDHGTGAIHLHMKMGASPSDALRELESDDSARFLDWFHCTRQTVPQVNAVLTQPLVIYPEILTAPRPRAVEHRAHDPPFVQPFLPRAPPF